MAWLEKRGNKYFIVYREGSKTRRISAYTDKAASKQRLAKFEQERARGLEGLVDKFAEHRTKPILDHLKDFIADLGATGRSSKYTNNCEKRITILVNKCGWKLLGDVTADSFSKWRETIPTLEDGRPELGPGTQNQYLETMIALFRWCIKRKRVEGNPLTGIEKVDETADVRRGRRALTEEEVERLLVAVATPHRLLYRFILSTGLRRSEVEQLVWGDVRLNSPTPFLQLRAKTTKAKRADVIPLRSVLAEELAKERGDAEDSDSVFISLPTMDEHRDYLTAAKIDWEDSEKRRADFHALRHTYGTLLSKSGCSPREAMELMRHSYAS